MQDRFEQVFGQLQTSWAEVQRNLADSARLRIGVWVILLILVLYIVLVVADIAAEVSDQYQQVHTRLLKVQNLEGQDYWADRLAIEKAVSRELLARVQQSSSESLARAGLQVEIDKIIKSAQLKSASLNLGAFEPVKGTNLYRLAAELTAQMSKGSALTMLEAFASYQSLVGVEMFEMTLDGNRRIHVQFSVYFSIVKADR